MHWISPVLSLIVDEMLYISISCGRIIDPWVIALLMYIDGIHQGWGVVGFSVIDSVSWVHCCHGYTDPY